MNSLLFLPSERTGEVVILSGERWREISERHQLVAGNELSVAELGGQRGRGVVREVSAESVTCVVTLDQPPRALMPIELVVGIARPQTMKKVIQFAVSFGVARLSFVRAESAERSYLEASILEPTELQAEVLKALEQTGDSVPPQIEVQQRFRPFVEDTLRARIEVVPDPLLLLADPRSSSRLPLIPSSPGTRSWIAVGPEAGWNEFEHSALCELGFKPTSLGGRVLRVESAVAVAVGQVALVI